MQVGAVQALVVILDDELPVRSDVVDNPVSQPQVLHPPGPELCRQVGELGRERWRVRRHIQEEMSVPIVDMCPMQGEVLLAKMRDLLHVRRAHQTSVEPVSPRVVGALNAAGELAGRFRAEASASMPAHVVERMHGPIVRARDDDAVAGDLAEHVLTRPRDFLSSTGADPHRAKECVELAAEVLRVSVEPSG